MKLSTDKSLGSKAWKQHRYLITTADEKTWKFDRPVIFLGEWCRLYNRKHIWQGMDAIVAEPYGLGKKNKDSDYAEARSLEKKIFPLLCEVINNYHNTSHDINFWEVVLGHWFRRYVDVIFNRVRTLEQCIRLYQLSGTTTYSTDRYDLAPLDSYSTIWAFNDDRWNNALYTRILTLLEVTNVPIEIIDGEKHKNFRLYTKTTVGNLNFRIIKWFHKQVGKLSGLMVRKTDAFIINSYLPRNEQIKLELAMLQIPQFWTSPNLEFTSSSDHSLRFRLTSQISKKESDILFQIMCLLLFEIIPVCYLEGFTELANKVEDVPWPREPKFIFTSNSFDTDEIFKLWTANKIESGSKYIAGQHGNNYGTYRYMYPTIEESTADKFLTWGWNDEMQQHIPAFIFKKVGCNKKLYNPNGGLLLIEDTLCHRLNTWDSAHEFEKYFENQELFVKSLDEKLKQELTIRIHPSYKLMQSFEISRWHDYDSSLKINSGEDTIDKLISKSRLVIHGYDSTGILETLSQNIPTLAFWQNGFDHLRSSAISHYQLLVDAGIVHFTPESVASKVNTVWDDVDGWWHQKSVIDARQMFCSRYAKIELNPITKLHKILSE